VICANLNESLLFRDCFFTWTCMDVNIARASVVNVEHCYLEHASGRLTATPSRVPHLTLTINDTTFVDCSGFSGDGMYIHFERTAWRSMNVTFGTSLQNFARPKPDADNSRCDVSFSHFSYMDARMIVGEEFSHGVTVEYTTFHDMKPFLCLVSSKPNSFAIPGYTTIYRDICIVRCENGRSSLVAWNVKGAHGVFINVFCDGHIDVSNMASSRTVQNCHSYVNFCHLRDLNVSTREPQPKTLPYEVIGTHMHAFRYRP
jgi:hypothetical protein